jgi:hypothetical protein
MPALFVRNASQCAFADHVAIAVELEPEVRAAEGCAVKISPRFTTSEIYVDTLTAPAVSSQGYSLASLRYDLSKIEKADEEKIARPGGGGPRLRRKRAQRSEQLSYENGFAENR